MYDDFLSFTAERNSGSFGGIVTGTVKQNYDKDHPGMIKVELFLGEEGRNVTGWVAVMSPYAGSGHGFYTLPEVGSEVVVAFNMGDRNRPVVLGSLWSGKNKLPQNAATEKNTSKQLVTKGGNTVIIDDTQDKQKITVATKSGSGIVLDDEKKIITVHDNGGKNTVEIDSEKGTVTISADKKLIFKVGGSSAVVIDGTRKIAISSGDVALSASKGLEAKGQTTKIEGTSVKINGSSSLQVSSSGSTQVKGAIVKIN